MILSRRTLAAMLLPVALSAVPAHADVLEIDSDGEARWIAGPAPRPEPQAALAALAALGSDPRAAALAEIPAEAWLVPETAVADPAGTGRAIPPAYAARVSELSARYDLAPALIEALVWQESRWRANAVSPAGARGLAQLMPGTARDLGVNPDDPNANLEGGARYLREQLNRFDGDIEKALAAYNAGPGRVMRANGIPRIRETQSYVTAIIGRLSDHSRSSQ